MTKKFLNSREWRSFLAAAHCPVTYPTVTGAIRASHAWLSGGAAKTHSWLLVNGNLVAVARKTVRA